MGGTPVRRGILALDIEGFGQHSRTESGRLRLRVAVHEGHVLADAHGHSGEAVNHTFRLLDAQAARAMLAGYPDADAVLIISDTLYQEVVRHAYQGLDPAVWQPVGVHAKETRTRGWVHVPGLARQPDVPSALAGDGEGGDDAAAHQGF